jgi:MFS family permease
MIRDYKPIFKNSTFAYLWFSQILSQFTINIMNFLLLTYLYTATGSSIATSFLWIAFSLPAIIIGPFGAASVDLVDRRKMLMVTNLLQALTILLFVFIYGESVFIIYVVVFIYSALNQFYVPAESATLPATVSKNHLQKANSLFFITMQGAVIFGFGIAGLLQRTIGLNGALILSTVFLFVAFVSVSFLPPNKPRKIISGEFEKDLKTFFATIMEGYEFISKNKTILLPILILLAIQAGLAVIITNMPSMAAEVLNISVNLAGISLVVPAGIGALIGSIYIPRLSKRTWRKKTIVEISLAIVSVALLGVAIGVPILPLAVRLTVTSILIIITGFAFVGVNIPTITFLQENTPEWFRGRVFGNLWFMVTIANMIPVLFSGAITELFGVRTLLVIMAIAALLMLFYSLKKGQVIIRENFN